MYKILSDEELENETKQEYDNIDRPAHYAEGRTIEPIDVIIDWGLNFCLGNVVKYISRAGRKDGSTIKEDLLKARKYLDFEISKL